MPYLDQGEFYSEFGDFDISITLPENYVVAATGELQNADEKEWLKKRAAFTWEPIRKKIKKGGSIKTVVQKFPASSIEIKTLRFRQARVHDFAWFADKRFIVDHDTCRLASGKTIDVYTTILNRKKNTGRTAFLLQKMPLKQEVNGSVRILFQLSALCKGLKVLAGVWNILPLQSSRQQKMKNYWIIPLLMK